MTLASHLARAHDALLRGDRSNAVREAFDGLLLAPNSADAAFLLGVAWHPRWFARTLAVASDHLGAAVNLAQALVADGRRPLALRVLRRSVATMPAKVQSLVNLALLAEVAAARWWVARAAAVDPGDVLVRINQGTILDRLGMSGPAAREHRRAVALAPNLELATLNLALAYFSIEQVKEARRWHRRTLAADPESIDALAGLGALARADGQSVAGRSWDRRALTLLPAHQPTLSNLSYGDLLAGEAQSALGWSRRAADSDPKSAALGSAALALLQYLPWPDPAEALRRHQRWAGRHTRPKERPPGRAGAVRPLRVGYLSADLRRHPVGYFALPLLEGHDPAAVTVICYAASEAADEVTSRIRSVSTHWRQVASFDDRLVADLVRSDDIDILIDLAGHTAGNRLGVFAERPAPIQATWLGYYDTTGMSVFDAALVDPYEVPQGSERWFSEPVIRLPAGRLVYRPPVAAPAVGDRAADGALLLGCFNNPAKIGSDAIALWSRVLTVLPKARLKLKAGSYAEASVRERYRALFAAAGIDPNRIEFSGWSPHAVMLAELTEIDIALDPTPFSGCLTSCEALWMGVPVVTLAGGRPVERQTAALLTRLELNRLIAETADDYVTIVRDLGSDSGLRQSIRGSLRSRMRASSLYDEIGFARAMEAIYRRLWVETTGA